MKTKVFALSVMLAAAFAFAQAPQPVSVAVASDTAGTVAMLVKYVGTSTSATTDVEVEAAGNMVFRVAGAADALVNTVAQGSVCGATPGTLDLSTPAATCNSMGEVVDIINLSGDWIAVLVDSMRDDLTDNILQTRSVTSGVNSKGVPLYIDSAVALYAGGALLPSGCQTDITCWTAGGNKLTENPAGGTVTSLKYLAGFSTWNTTSNFQVWSVKSSNKKTGGSSTATKLFQAAAGATGTNAIAVATTGAPIIGRPHERLIVRIVDTATGSAFTVNASGTRTGVN